MTEAGSTPSSQGLFRTPLACALLTGALAIALNDAFNQLPRNAEYFFVDINITRGLRYGTQCALLAIQLAGPALYRRSWKTCASIVLAASLITLATVTFSFVFINLGPGGRALGSAAQWQMARYHSALRTLLRFLLLGASLAWLYRTKTLWSSVVLAMIGALPVVLFHCFIHAWNGSGFDVGTAFWETKEGQALLWLVDAYYLFVPIVLATIPIDRALRAKEPRRVVGHD